MIAGTARSLKLKTPAGNDVRPTTDRIKETLFNIINPYIYGCNFLDLFSGSGGIGIEALSRGAERAVFVDNSPVSIACINENIVHVGFTEKANVLRSDAVNAVSKLHYEGKRFDIIFLDPPYDKLLEKDVLESLIQFPLLNDDGIIIVEASADTEFDYLDSSCLEVFRVKSYGSNKHVFIRKR